MNPIAPLRVIPPANGGVGWKRVGLCPSSASKVAVHTVFFYSSIEAIELVDSSSSSPFGAKMVA